MRFWTMAAVGCFLVAVVVVAVYLAARLGISWAERIREIVKQLPGFQAGNISAYRSSVIVLSVADGVGRFKVLQVAWGKDGSVYVTFPYFRHRTGLLSATTSPATGHPVSLVNLEQRAKITSHRIKYSHHPTGRAHFNQPGKTTSEIGRQSVKLAGQEGHLFTVLINGLH